VAFVASSQTGLQCAYAWARRGQPGCGMCCLRLQSCVLRDMAAQLQHWVCRCDCVQPTASSVKLQGKIQHTRHVMCHVVWMACCAQWLWGLPRCYSAVSAVVAPTRWSLLTTALVRALSDFI
jgi:hypothetical protein